VLHTAIRNRVGRGELAADLRFRLGLYHVPLLGVEAEHLRFGLLALERLDPLAQSVIDFSLLLKHCV
jgi:hypothetical protein